MIIALQIRVRKLPDPACSFLSNFLLLLHAGYPLFICVEEALAVVVVIIVKFEVVEFLVEVLLAVVTLSWSSTLFCSGVGFSGSFYSETACFCGVWAYSLS